MSLETEIKKLTDAVTALTAAMSGQAVVGQVAAAPAQQYTPPPAPAQQYTPPPAQQQPQYTPPPVQQYQAPATLPAMTPADAQRELGMIMQRLGPAAAPQLQQLIAQYGNGATTLSAVPVANLSALVSAAQTLVQQ